MSTKLTKDGVESAPTKRRWFISWWMLLLVMLPVTAYEKLAHSTWPSHYYDSVVTAAIELVIVAAIAAGVVVNRPRNPWPWLIVALGEMLGGSGDLTDFFFRIMNHHNAFPSPADGMWLSGVLVLGVGVYFVANGRQSGRDGATVIDASIVAVAAGLFSWTFLISPYVHMSGLSSSGRIAAMAYPLLDVFMFWQLARLALRRGQWSMSLTLLFAGFGIMWAGHWVLDIEDLRTLLNNAQVRLFDLTFMTANLLVASAALHPAMARRVEGNERKAGPPSRLRLGLLGVASLSGPFVLLLNHGHHAPENVPVVATACAVMFALVLVRMVGLVQVQVQLNGQLKSLVDQLNKVDSELRHAQKMEAVGKLAAGLAHEINTPIQFISDNLRFVKSSVGQIFDAVPELQASEAADDLEFLKAEVPQAVDDAIGGLDRVGRIVTAMKVFGHPDSSGVVQTDVNEIVENTLTVAQGEFREVADVVTDLGDVPSIMCNVGDLDQVLLNLVTNAVHAIADSGERGTLSVRTRVEQQDLVIEVQDSGVGIPDDIRQRVFEPFFTTKDVGRGTGQGLSVVWTLVVDRHGGSVEFDTEVGTGTTFRVRLPLNANASSASEEAAQAVMA
jgi:signal transduction histidine kinase